MDRLLVDRVLASGDGQTLDEWFSNLGNKQTPRGQALHFGRWTDSLLTNSLLHETDRLLASRLSASEDG